MKNLIWSSLLVIGFVVSPAMRLEGALLTSSPQRHVIIVSQLVDPPFRNPNTLGPSRFAAIHSPLAIAPRPDAPKTLAFDPPIPDPNHPSPIPPAIAMFDPPIPDPNHPSPIPPAMVTFDPPIPDPNHPSPIPPAMVTFDPPIPDPNHPSPIPPAA